jgi:TfoX/Sxy family transcriptional regulator of competence genes
MNLEDRLAKALALHDPISKKMFGGTCYMINGNMVIGTFRGGIIARIGKEARHALKLPGATPFEMRGRIMTDYITVAEPALASDVAFTGLIDLCLAFNKTLPAKPAGKTKKAN